MRWRRKPSGESCTTKSSRKEPLRLTTISSGASVIGQLANFVIAVDSLVLHAGLAYSLPATEDTTHKNFCIMLEFTIIHHKYTLSTFCLYIIITGLALAVILH